MIYQPLLVKEQIIKSGTEAASMILRIDDVIAASKSKGPGAPAAGAGGAARGYGGYEGME
jgi:archaeal chaperonin